MSSTHQKIQSIRIVSTFFGLWISAYLLGGFENYVAFFLIFSLGILHGSNDITLIKRAYGSENLTFFKVLTSYIMLIGLGTALFFLVPMLALIIFIVFSAYHFGEQHFHFLQVKNTISAYLFYFGYGLFVITLILYLNASDALRIINQMIGVVVVLDVLRWTLLASAILTLVTGTMVYIKQKFNVFLELFYLLLFSVVFFIASLIWSFTLYFILWHSLPSLADQVEFLYKEVTKETIVRYIRASFIYWLLSVVGFFVLVQFFKDNPTVMLSFFFSFLAAITFPHVLVMHKILKH
ncbi:beta-carotene 15,15'-monooxygenase [Paucihalobacter ruber]|uniref:Probable beta-carotene 15,15'-dioxygenase n=1 Tax=Paucihalobacter ruber TaxID=2567861 RepID=A0A506PKH2_9FLAO|nr:Brp/Blh family beta-carotene 15,15'-dioxygenase [Paucihalobacter ruber]TPV34129.1 beta-carotene 15,15'-monooxygenase [Paucihalobacter ruber]